jgi:hypothetical protein
MLVSINLFPRPMYVEMTDNVNEVNIYAIQHLTERHIYIMLQGLCNIRNAIQEHPTVDNIQYLEEVKTLIKTLESK